MEICELLYQLICRLKCSTARSTYSTMVMWESSQWLENMLSTGKRSSKKALVGVLDATIQQRMLQNAEYIKPLPRNAEF